MRRLGVGLTVLAGASLALGGCRDRPVELGVKEREVGEQLESCLRESVQGLRRSSPGAIDRRWTATDGALVAGAPKTATLPQELEANRWVADDVLLLVIGRPKELTAKTPDQVTGLSAPSVLIWEGMGPARAVDTCLERVAFENA